MVNQGDIIKVNFNSQTGHEQIMDALSIAPAKRETYGELLKEQPA